MAVTTGETDIVGGGGGYGFGGFGGIAPVGLIGLNTLFGNNGFGFNNGNGTGIPGTTVLEQNVSDLRRDVAETSINVERLGNEMQQAFATQNLAFAGDFRNLDNQICDVEKTLLQQSYAQSLQAFQNTQAIQNQMSNFQHATDQQFCAVKQQINADGDATRALITQNMIDDLRSQLHSERRGRDNREIEINVQNTATATQAQLQTQLQQQQQQLATFMNVIGDQIARQTNSIVNLGTMTASGQSNSAAQTKVNS